ncbi:MAG: type II secretion system minor pseudopilin GspK [Hyphomonadaceae bacterium]|nr:type II secretion system minor pseudopilin GspK [Hyphomonadaceae bacterium]
MKWRDDAGAALLTTLIIVAALSAISVAAIADMQRSSRVSANASSVSQGQWYAIGAEAFALITAEDLVSGVLPRTALAGPPRTATFPLDNGIMRVAVRDGSTCINLNGVVAGAGDIFEREETGAAQLAALMESQGIPGGRAAELIDALVAWIDTDGGSIGSDDAPYAQANPPYLTGREPLAELSEARAIRGFTPEIMDRLRPWACALPQVGKSRINLNALTAQQAPVLVAASEGRIDLRQAQEMIRRRPAAGWQSIGEAFADPAMTTLQLPEEVISSFTLDTRFLAIDVLVTHGDAEVAMSGLLVRSGSGFVTAARRWTEDT